MKKTLIIRNEQTGKKISIQKSDLKPLPKYLPKPWLLAKAKKK